MELGQSTRLFNQLPVLGTICCIEQVLNVRLKEADVGLRARPHSASMKQLCDAYSRI